MNESARARLIGGAMVLVGLAQAFIGTRQGDTIFAGLGGAYALIGVAYLCAHGRGPSR
ncbi:hypothetical protein RBH20_08680 [Haloarcula sp. H-GB4]|uniref:hypothetical protein n=1 Tax=Haloarcula sp. H-GB4 TaxID=3069755 RepID=UPI0027B1F43B|nr:hypothetical protein [Haloarcula sp. H-GB4]MDQ2072609.1 hypothetical protein [Haloarcula sp. H-GB4]